MSYEAFWAIQYKINQSSGKVNNINYTKISILDFDN